LKRLSLVLRRKNWKNCWGGLTSSVGRRPFRRDEVTGEVVLSPKDSGEFIWKKLLKEMEELPEEERRLFPKRNVIATKCREPMF
jgi:hypothetical protein